MAIEVMFGSVRTREVSYTNNKSNRERRDSYLAGLTDVDLTTGTERGVLVTAAFVATGRSLFGTAGTTTELALHELLAIIDVVEASARARRQGLVAVVKVTHVRAAQALLLTRAAKVLVVAPLMDLRVLAGRIRRVTLTTTQERKQVK